MGINGLSTVSSMPQNCGMPGMHGNEGNKNEKTQISQPEQVKKISDGVSVKKSIWWYKGFRNVEEKYRTNTIFGSKSG